MSIIAGRVKTILEVDNKKFTTGIKDANKSLTSLGKQSKTTGMSISNMFKGFAVTGVVAGLSLVTKKVTSLASEMEDLQISISTMLKSDIQGSALITGIQKLASVTPFTSSKLSDAAKSLLAFGFSSDRIIPTLRTLGDISAGTGKDIKELAIIFGQIKSAGRLMGNDLLQLINAGFSPLQVISEKTGKSMAQLKDEMSRGLITFDQVEEAFRDATSEGGLFFNLMEKRSKSFSGRLSTLKDGIERVGIQLGSVAIDVLKPIVDSLIEATEALDRVLKGKGTKIEVALIGTTLITTLIAAIGVLTLSIVNLSRKIKGGFDRLLPKGKSVDLSFEKPKTGGLAQGLNPLGGIPFENFELPKINFHVKEIGRFANAITRLKGALAMLNPITVALSTITVAVVAFADRFKDLSEDSERWGTEIGFFDTFKMSIAGIFDFIKGIVGENVISKLVKSLEQLRDVFNPLSLTVKKLAEPFGGIGKVLSKLFGSIIGFIKDLHITLVGLGVKIQSLGKFDLKGFVGGGVELDAAPKELVEAIKRRARRRKEQKDFLANTNPAEFTLLPVAPFIGPQNERDLGPVQGPRLPTFEEKIKEKVRQQKEKQNQKLKNDALFNIDLLKLDSFFENQKIKDLIQKQENQFTPSGAFEMGSASAHSNIVSQREDMSHKVQEHQQKIDENTKAMRDILKKMSDQGIKMQNVELAF